MIDNPVVRYAVYDTPLGNVTIVATNRKISGLLFGSFDPNYAINEENIALYDAIVEINQFCYGQRKDFDIKTSYSASDEEKLVYDYVSSIPYGETRTIENIKKATKLNENLIYSILLKNPLPLFIPTHRIIDSKKESVVFTGENAEIGKQLLALERGEGHKVYTEGSYKDL